MIARTWLWRAVAAVRAARRLGRDRRGLALLEFAFMLPILLVLTLTGAEIANYTITKMRISQIALHVADNAARMGSGSQLAAKSISEAQINDLLTGAGLQSEELALFENGRVILSSFEPMASPNTTSRYKIAWQRCRGAQWEHRSTFGVAGTVDMTGIGPTGHTAYAPDDGATMFVEVYYRYRPIIRMESAPSSDMVQVASMMVRDRRDLTQPYNTEDVAVSSC